MHERPEEDDSNRIRFSPSLQEQRMSKVYTILRDLGITSVADLGCGEGTLTRILLNDGSFSELASLDCEESQVRSAIYSCQPSDLDLRTPRDPPTDLKLFEGDACEPDPRLRRYEAITLMEVIEHINPEQLPVLFDIVLGYYNPSIVIVTTPNKDFNINFSVMKYTNARGEGVRHPGHIFEWTHAEFREWCEKYALKYNYSITLDGVGYVPQASSVIPGPKSSCTQICIFRREGSRSPDSGGFNEKHKLLLDVYFPYEEVQRFTSEDIVEELLFNAGYLITQAYIDKHGSIDNVKSKDSYSESVTLYEIISSDDKCLEIKYKSCMLISSVRFRAVHIEVLIEAVKSDCGQQYFIHNSNEYFKIKNDRYIIDYLEELESSQYL